MLGVNKLLILADSCLALFDYLLQLPPPCYLYANYIDWIKPFILSYLEDSKKYQTSISLFNRLELAEEAWKNYLIFEIKIYNRFNFINYSSSLNTAELEKSKNEINENDKEKEN